MVVSCFWLFFSNNDGNHPENSLALSAREKYNDSYFSLATRGKGCYYDGVVRVSAGRQRIANQSVRNADRIRFLALSKGLDGDEHETNFSMRSFAAGVAEF